MVLELNPLSKNLKESIMDWKVLWKKHYWHTKKWHPVKAELKLLNSKHQEDSLKNLCAIIVYLWGKKHLYLKKILISSLLNSCLISFMLGESKRSKSMKLLRLWLWMKLRSWVIWCLQQWLMLLVKSNHYEVHRLRKFLYFGLLNRSFPI